MELWRSFFQDSRNRPVDRSGKEFSAPKCIKCGGLGKIEYERIAGNPDTITCPECEGRGIDENNIPTYRDEILNVGNIVLNISPSLGDENVISLTLKEKILLHGEG